MSSKTSKSTAKRFPRRSLQSLPSAHELSELEKARQNEVAMKAKIRTLEVEVDTLRYRLDSLRKAKNTTVIHREKEEIYVHTPLHGHRSQSFHSISHTSLQDCTTADSTTELKEQIGKVQRARDDLSSKLLSCKAQCDQLQVQYQELQSQNHQLQHRHEQDLKKLISEHKEVLDKMAYDKIMEREAETNKQCVANSEKMQDLLLELERVREQNAALDNQIQQLLSINSQLRESNLLLEGKCEALLEDLSVKEAQWSEKEDRLTAEIRRQWGEKYHEWITKAERKMEELQKINIMLQTMMKTKSHNPDL